jgi:hypothetical protein
MSWLRDLAVILLVAEAFVAALAPLVLCGAVVYGLWRLQRHENLPTWLRIGQAYLALALAYIELAMQMILRPVFAVHSAVAQVQGCLNAAAGLRRSGGDK